VNYRRKIQLRREGITILNSPAEATTLILIPVFQSKQTKKSQHTSEKSFFKTGNRYMEGSLNIIQFHLFLPSHFAPYLLMPGGSSFTTTLLLHAMRSLSVAIWLRGALWCICRTPSIWPLLRRPTFGGDATSKPGLRRAKEEKRFFFTSINHQ